MERQPTSVSPRRQCSEAGFTAIELLVVIVMIGILAAIAAPSWMAFVNRQRTNAVRSDVVQLLRNAQQDAIQRREARRVEVVTTAANPTLRVGPVSFDDAGNDTFNGRDEAIGGDANRSGQIIMQAYTVSGSGTANATKNTSITSITFNYRGLPLERERLPFVININTGPGTSQQCVIVASLMGSIKTASGTQCDNPSL